jgi:hypothetical protein
VPRDTPRARSILEAVIAETQDSEAVVALGWHHMTFGVAEDYVDAVNCFIEGMDDVNPEGTFGYGCGHGDAPSVPPLPTPPRPAPPRPAPYRHLAPAAVRGVGQGGAPVSAAAASPQRRQCGVWLVCLGRYACWTGKGTPRNVERARSLFEVGCGWSAQGTEFKCRVASGGSGRWQGAHVRLKTSPPHHHPPAPP